MPSTRPSFHDRGFVRYDTDDVSNPWALDIDYFESTGTGYGRLRIYGAGYVRLRNDETGDTTSRVKYKRT